MGEIVDFVQLYIDDSDILEDAADDIAVNLEDNIKDETPYLEGRLRRSIRVDTRVHKKYAIITGYWDDALAPHGIFVLAGTKPHDIVIRPKNAKALKTPYGFYKKVVVHHPGTKANDFLGRGLKRTVQMYR